MKLFILSITVSIVLNITQANQFTQIIAKCKEQEKVSDADVEKVSKGQYPETKEGKCMAACIAETVGTIKDNKLFMGEAISNLSKAFGMDEDKRKKFEEVIKACEEVTNEDRCEAAFEIQKCIKEASKARGLNIVE